jgi:hypothetical protein
MTSIKDAFPIPILYVNKYLWAKMCEIDTTMPTTYKNIVPFFPLADSRAGDAGWGSKPYVVYDMMFKLRGKPFYPVKKVQVLYFVRGTAEDVIAWSNAIGIILDREDAAAQDINEHFASLNQDAGVYFHRLRIMQVDMVNDNRQDLSVRQQYTASLVVEMEYHITSDNSFD